MLGKAKQDGRFGLFFMMMMRSRHPLALAFNRFLGREVSRFNTTYVSIAADEDGWIDGRMNDGAKHKRSNPARYTSL